MVSVARGFWCVAAIVAFGLGTTARADPGQVAPADWARSENGAITVYRSGTGREAMIFREMDNVSDPALAVQIIADGLSSKSTRIVQSAPSRDGPLAIHNTVYENRNILMQAKVFGVRKTDGAFLVLAHLAPQSEPGLAARLQSSAQKMAGLASGSPASTARNVKAPPSPAAIAAPASGGKQPGNILFDLSYKYGVGGAAYPVYNLVALYRDGTAAKFGGYAVDSVNIAALRRKSAGNVGQWRKSAGKFDVRWGNGKSSKLSPTVGPPRALPNRSALIGRFQAIGGGGNTAMGGGVLTAQVKQFDFRSDGRFSHSTKKSASSGAGVGGSQSGSAGRWSLNGPTLTLAYNGGRTVRTSVFYSASRKTSARGGRYGVLWIGGDDYRRAK